MKKTRYSPHPMFAREEAAKEKLLQATGKSFDQWVLLARKQGPKDHKRCTAWIRTKHGLASMTAWSVAFSATSDESESYEQPEKLVDALYSGPKASLRPLHEKVVDAALKLGSDVVVTACKTMVPIYRKHVFAELRPTSDGVELQLALGASASSKRFENVANRNAGDRLTHRLILKTPEDLDEEFLNAFKKAYEAGAGKILRDPAGVKAPADLLKKLRGAAKRTWDACTPAMQRDWIVWIDSAKQAETRARRIDQAAAKLAAGKNGCIKLAY
jgi:hypothetical protein